LKTRGLVEKGGLIRGWSHSKSTKKGIKKAQALQKERNRMLLSPLKSFPRQPCQRTRRRGETSPSRSVSPTASEKIPERKASQIEGTPSATSDVRAGPTNVPRNLKRQTKRIRVNPGNQIGTTYNSPLKIP